MSEDNWVNNSILNSRRHALLVPDAVWTAMEILLNGRFSQQPLAAIELQSIATKLIDEVAAPLSEQHY